ncbi:MAG: hypothetical protein ACK46X_01225 [Candidatus Sericytochromatia bacterium]
MHRITVTVEGVPYSVLQGAEAWVLIDQLPAEQQHALKNGLAYFTDRFGNQVGEGGGLADGQCLGSASLACGRADPFEANRAPPGGGARFIGWMVREVQASLDGRAAVSSQTAATRTTLRASS